MSQFILHMHSFPVKVKLAFWGNLPYILKLIQISVTKRKQYIVSDYLNVSREFLLKNNIN